MHCNRILSLKPKPHLFEMLRICTTICTMNSQQIELVEWGLFIDSLSTKRTEFRTAQALHTSAAIACHANLRIHNTESVHAAFLQRIQCINRFPFRSTRVPRASAIMIQTELVLFMFLFFSLQITFPIRIETTCYEKSL